MRDDAAATGRGAGRDAGEAAGRDRADRRDRERERPPLAEWVTGGLGLLLALGAVGTILYEGLFVAGTPPELEVAVERVRRVGNGWLVEFEATNRGGSTAAQVKVEGRLMRGAEEVEAAEAVLDYVPAGSERKGGLFFGQDPGALALDLRAVGYSDP